MIKGKWVVALTASLSGVTLCGTGFASWVVTAQSISKSDEIALSGDDSISLLNGTTLAHQDSLRVGRYFFEVGSGANKQSSQTGSVDFSLAIDPASLESRYTSVLKCKGLLTYSKDLPIFTSTFLPTIKVANSAIPAASITFDTETNKSVSFVFDIATQGKNSVFSQTISFVFDAQLLRSYKATLPGGSFTLTLEGRE